MPAEPEIFDELRRLRARVPHLTGSLVASVEGLVLAQDTQTTHTTQPTQSSQSSQSAREIEPEGLAALTAAALGVALRLVEATGQGAFRELVLRGEDGYIATYAAGPTAVLTVLAAPRANVGRLHLEARRSGASIAFLTASAAGGARTAGGPVRPAPSNAGVPRAGEPLPVRRLRTHTPTER